MNISMKLVYQHMTILLLSYPHQIIFIHYKSKIATAIRGLQWMKMTMENSGLKGLYVLLAAEGGGPCTVVNPLTAGADYIRFLNFLLACTISAFKDIEDKM